MNNKEDAKRAIKQVAKDVIATKASTQTARQPVGFSATAQFQSHAFQGPLPHPDTLKAYGEIVKDGAERIVSMAEREQRHSHRIDILSIIVVGAGQAMGFIIILSGVLGGLWMVWNEKPISGFASFFAGLGVLLGGGYIGRSKRLAAPRHSDPK